MNYMTWCLLAAAALGLSSCAAVTKKPEEPAKPAAAPAIRKGTVGELAVISGAKPILVQGYSLVTGLKGSGGGVLPQSLREEMIKELARHGIRTPERVLADPDNAVVEVAGLIPPGAAKGERFDLSLAPARGTDTVSLEGGFLLQTDLGSAEDHRGGTYVGSLMAEGKGPVFVSPFLLPSDKPTPAPTGGPRPITREESAGNVPSGAAAPTAELTPKSDPRLGRVLGGGRNSAARSLVLQLIDPSSRAADQIMRQINARFNDAAVGRLDPSVITLRIPRSYAHDKSRFLNVVGSIFLSDNPGQREDHLRELVRQLRNPAERDGAAYGLEAFGKACAPLLEPLQNDPDPAVRFYAARTLTYVGATDTAATLEQFVRDDSSPFQEQAVRALGEIVGGAKGQLLAAFDARNPTVRFAAYQTLARISPSLLPTVHIEDKMDLALVPSKSEPFVFVARQIRPLIVVFGNVAIKPPLIVDTPRYLVTVGEGGAKATLISKSMGGRHAIETSLSVVDIVATMAGPANATGESPEPKGLDLAYSDIVGFLDRAYKEGAMNAQIVLEPVQFVGPGAAAKSSGKPAGPESDIVIPEK
jgi:hypothetical protein